MKVLRRISDNEKWQAVVSCDSGYEGMFLYGVKTTRVFCRPSCKSKTPVRANVSFFNNAAEAIASGFRPCKRCCPDKVSFEPDLELIKKAKNIFDVDYNNEIDLNHISKQLGVSKNHLIKLFKELSGITPLQYLIKLRVEKAEELLRNKDKSIIETAYVAGFRSLSNFYKCFKAETGYTPNEFRKSRGGL